mmetsp:Transcript_87431/g.255689  ORF Transcript_87431/g.255689 Transcript_87431/m.255689 type:complete len:91 (-) Transcript_87431:576-848(-)
MRDSVISEEGKDIAAKGLFGRPFLLVRNFATAANRGSIIRHRKEAKGGSADSRVRNGEARTPQRAVQVFGRALHALSVCAISRKGTRGNG